MVKLIGVWSFGTRSSLKCGTNFCLGEAGSQSLRAINLFSDILKLFFFFFFFKNWVLKCLILFTYNSFDNSFSKKQINKLYKTENILYTFWKWKNRKEWTLSDLFLWQGYSIFLHHGSWHDQWGFYLQEQSMLLCLIHLLYT